MLGMTMAAIRRAARRLRGPDRADEILMAVGSLEAHLLDLRQPRSLQEAEFKVFSQYGEDGIIQYLLRHVLVTESTFVEIGVESYREANTRFLALNDNWRGMIVDGSSDHLRFLSDNDISWRTDVLPIRSFVNRENVNSLLGDNGFEGEIGLLSIDVDGMDYWIWDAIDVVFPAIVVIEFNAIFGPGSAVTVPYDPQFVLSQAHWSHQYFGASLSALHSLGQRKGYEFVGVNSNMVNAFFVRKHLVGSLPTPLPSDVWRPSRFLSSRNKSGKMSHVRHLEDRLRLIRGCELEDVRTGAHATVATIFGV